MMGNISQIYWQGVKRLIIFVPICTQVEIPFGITAHKDTLYYTNWVTTSTQTGSVTSYNTVTKETRTILHHLSNPSGIVFVNTSNAVSTGLNFFNLYTS